MSPSPAAAPPAEPPALELRGVSFAYGERRVLEEVSLALPAGGLVSVVGPNGGGKTTLLKLCLGLLQPQKGEVRVLGRSPTRARAEVGYVPQHFNFDAHYPVSVGDVVLMGRLGPGRRFGFFGGEDRGQAARALGEVGLDGVSARPFAALSGGQRQRVLIARALAGAPRLLLLDEPTANVDPNAAAELHGLLERLSDRHTVLLVTHDMNFVHAGTQTVLCVHGSVEVHPTGEVPAEAGFFHAEPQRLRRVLHHRHIHDGGPKEGGR